MKRSFKNNFRREKQVARSFQKLCKTSFHKKKNFQKVSVRKFLKLLFYNKEV